MALNYSMFILYCGLSLIPRSTSPSMGTAASSGQYPLHLSHQLNEQYAENIRK